MPIHARSAQPTRPPVNVERVKTPFTETEPGFARPLERAFALGSVSRTSISTGMSENVISPQNGDVNSPEFSPPLVYGALSNPQSLAQAWYVIGANLLNK